MTAEIIAIGDELLIGQVIDTNSSFIAKELNKIGVSVHQISAIEDEREHILQTLKEASLRADIIIISGGLGPTKDDLTKECLREYFNDELIPNKEVLQHIKDLFEKYIETPISQLNIDQALVPSKAEVLFNEYGTAPGMWFFENGKVYVSLPGVPFEMKAIIEKAVIPKLQSQFSRPFIIHKTVITHGLGESAVAQKIESWEDNLPKEIKLAYLPNLGRVRLRLTAKGKDEQHLKDILDSEIAQLHLLIGDIISGYEDEDAIEIQIGKILASNNESLSTAESCTGGKIAAGFAVLPGASIYFKGSALCYATQAKMDILQVPKELIDKHSVVSAEVAKAMANQAVKIFKSDYAIATTGNAGPLKGDSDAEVGTVFIAIKTPTNLICEEFHFGNHREKVIGKAVNKSLELLLKMLISSNKKIL